MSSRINEMVNQVREATMEQVGEEDLTEAGAAVGQRIREIIEGHFPDASAQHVKTMVKILSDVAEENAAANFRHGIDRELQDERLQLQ